MPVRRYLGARTAFGIIVHIAERIYNPEAVVQAEDGSTRSYSLPFLMAHGPELADANHDLGVQCDRPRSSCPPAKTAGSKENV